MHAAYAADSRTLTLTRDYPHPIARVWAAIATPARIADWMGVEWLGDAGAALREGAHFDYRFHGSDTESRAHILRYDPPHLLEHSWFENLPPPATVRWALEEKDGGTRLTLAHVMPVPDDAPRTGAGWTTLLEALGASLDGVPFKPARTWTELRDDYAARFGPEATRDGRVRRVGGRAILTFERILHHPRAAVWDALTTPAGIARWWQSTAEVEPRVGGRFHVAFDHADHSMTGTITAFDPPRRFAFTWPELGDGDSVVTFDLAEHPAGCRLVLTHDLPGDADVADFASGWHWHIDGLDDAAAGRATPWDEARWKALRGIYGQTLA